jgi:hypothetical protein
MKLYCYEFFLKRVMSAVLYVQFFLRCGNIFFKKSTKMHFDLKAVKMILSVHHAD